MGFDVSMTGDKALTKILISLETKAAKKIVRPALRKGAKLVRKAAMAAAPRLSGNTADHVVVKASSGRGIVGIQVRTGKRSEMRIPDSAKYYYPAARELGTEKVTRRPWLRPALDANRGAALSVISAEMWRRVELLGLGSEPAGDEGDS